MFEIHSKLQVRSPTSVVALNADSPKSSDCTHDSYLRSGKLGEEVGLGVSDVTFQHGDVMLMPSAGTPPVSRCELIQAQNQIVHLQQRIKDMEYVLEYEISLREHYEQEAEDANAAAEDFFQTTVQMAKNIATTERVLEMKFLAMQHSIAVFEACCVQHGHSIIKNDVFEDTASSS
jgi:hypothetical protein